jgi:Predicted transcriptional regulators
MNLKIKDLCKQQGITLSDLADRMNIKRESLSRAINGNPTLESLEKIAIALGVDIVDLFDHGSDKTVIVCPNCGKQITLCIKE